MTGSDIGLRHYLASLICPQIADARIPTAIRASTAVYHKTMVLPISMSPGDTEILIVHLPGAAYKNSGSGPYSGSLGQFNVLAFTGATGSSIFNQFRSNTGIKLDQATNTTNICSRFYGITSGALPSAYNITMGTSSNQAVAGPVNDFVSGVISNQLRLVSSSLVIANSTAVINQSGTVTAINTTGSPISSVVYTAALSQGQLYNNPGVTHNVRPLSSTGSVQHTYRPKDPNDVVFKSVEGVASNIYL